MVRSSWRAWISMLAPCLLLCAGSHAPVKAHNSQTLIDDVGNIVPLHATEDVVSHAPTKQKRPFSKFAHTKQQRDAEAAQHDELDDDDREDELVVDEQEQWEQATDAPAVGRESEENTKSNRSMMDRAAMLRNSELVYLDRAIAGKSPRRRRQNCVMHGWGAWGNCNKACGGGKQSRSRGVKTAVAHGGKACPPSTETKDCNQQSCCAWTNWGPWGHCSKTCGGGKQERSQNHNGKCEGEKKEGQDCNTNPCPVDCVWNPFDPWGKCDKTCGGGKHSRVRNKKVTEAHGGKCEEKSEMGINKEEKVCNEDACPTTTTTTTTTTAAALVLPKSGCIQAAHASLALLAFIGVASP